MKIAYFTESLPPLVDGVTRTLCNLVNTLEKDSISYRFFAPVKPESDVAWRDKVHKVASAPFFLYKYYRIGLPYFNGIDRQLDSFKPDVVHVVSPTLLGLYGIQYAHKNKIPVVASYHTHFVSYFNYYGFSQMEQIGWSYLSWFHNKCARTFTPSASAMRELRQNGVQEVELWPHGVELDRFSPDHRSAALRQSIGAENKPLLLFVGRLVKEKDLDDLAAASELLRERGHDFALAFVGDGPMKQELQTRLPYRPLCRSSTWRRSGALVRLCGYICLSLNDRNIWQCHPRVVCFRGTGCGRRPGRRWRLDHAGGERFAGQAQITGGFCRNHPGAVG